MTLNKLASWGVAPPALPRPPGLGDPMKLLVSEVKVGHDAVATSLRTVEEAIAAASSSTTAAMDDVKAAIAALQAPDAGIVDALARIGHGIETLAGAAASKPEVPSVFAFRLLARLGQVRDALCDLHPSTPATANRRMRTERGAQETQLLLQTLRQLHPEAADRFVRQFADLENNQDDVASFERRSRLAELMAFERWIAASVEDPPLERPLWRSAPADGSAS